MERLALITIILPFVGAFIVGLNKQSFPKSPQFLPHLLPLAHLLWRGSGMQMAHNLSPMI